MLFDPPPQGHVGGCKDFDGGQRGVLGVEDSHGGNVARELQAAVDVRQVVRPILEGGAGDDGVDAASGEHAGKTVAHADDGDHDRGVRPRIQALHLCEDVLGNFVGGGDDGLGHDAESAKGIEERLCKRPIGSGGEDNGNQHGKECSKEGGDRL